MSIKISGDVPDGIAKVEKKEYTKKPSWLRVRLPTGEKYKKVRSIVDENNLNTICQSGNCPNMGECWGAGTATFMILGNTCTRSCGFCAVNTGRPDPVDWEEPQKVAEAIQKMDVKHAVLTSVDRDELKDGGSILWGKMVEKIRELNPNTTLETLIPDFKGIEENIQRVVDVAPEVVSHNVETVERLTRKVRIQAKYHRSLEVIRYLKDHGMRTKSGIMLGLGEKKDEVVQTMQDLYDNGCDVVTLGQYLQPTPKHLQVERFIRPQEFEEYKQIGYEEIGLDFVESGPLVRSSYHAERHLHSGKEEYEASKRKKKAS
ncbi:MAG TPA: lipoyl synthase [Chitinophagaceae bacterium]|nr:lipoyl synthase [Chitinophagaceae bacterium]